MIRKTHLPPDATLIQVAGELAEPEAYLRRLLGNMRFCQKRHGDALVRIGVTGKAGPKGSTKGGAKGLSPSYRIDYHADGVVTVFNGFGGTSHSAFTETNVRETNWSRGHATIQEVQRLYDDLRRDELHKDAPPREP
ncbi:hypothetical protein [Methylobacterium sp.]|jgi:hypothetical protein|uniref:hypothetical protein n=1 Tax=Methylobacterium sp. TaxID=409 RepID=UPI0025FB0880|nr:hypothetical protein [Methylobacterium sp.]MBY0256792.1 hypothetical protein [Methylobacterium sp.]